jgi:hypothetical protein
MARKSYAKRGRKTRRNKSTRRKRGGNVNDLSEYLQTLGQGSERDNLRLAFRAILQSAYNIIKDDDLKNELHRLQGINNIKFLDVRSPDDPPLDNNEAQRITNGIVEAFRK